MGFCMLSVRPPRHICHVVVSLGDVAQNEQVFANIRQFPSPHYEHTLIVLHKAKKPPLRLPHHTSCLELALDGSLLNKIRTCHQALCAIRPDVCQTYGDQTLPVQWLAHRAGIPLRLHIAGQGNGAANWLARKGRVWSHKIFKHSCDFVIAADKAQEAWLKTNAGIEESKIKRVRAGIDIKTHRPPLQDVSLRNQTAFIGTLPVPANRFVIGLPVTGIGKEAVEQFLAEYVAALKHSTAFSAQALLLIIGNSPYLSFYRRFLEQHDVSDNQARFCNHHAESERFFHLLDAIVTLDDGTQPSFALLEAMSMGLPVISGRAGDSPKDDNHPLFWLTDNGSHQFQYQMLTLYSDARKRIRLGQASRSYVLERYHHAEHQARYEKLYQLLEHRIPPRMPTSVTRYPPSPTRFKP